MKKELEQNVDMIILDNFAARSESARLGLPVKGTLGIIKRLYELEKISLQTQELHKKLKKINFRIADNIFWRIFD